MVPLGGLCVRRIAPLMFRSRVDDIPVSMLPLSPCMLSPLSPPAGLKLAIPAATASFLPDVEAAESLGSWAVAALCRSLSLENILTFLTAALLERQVRARPGVRLFAARPCATNSFIFSRHAAASHSQVHTGAPLCLRLPLCLPARPPARAAQVVVFCPNLGLLSGVVLALVPLLLPFSWQCVMLPVLPASSAQLGVVEVRGAQQGWSGFRS